MCNIENEKFDKVGMNIHVCVCTDDSTRVNENGSYLPFALLVIGTFK